MPDGRPDIKVDKMGYSFARIMSIVTLIGIILMVVPTILYLTGADQYVPITVAEKYWSQTANDFWINVTGKPVKGYSWIFDHLEYMDCLSMLGIIILMFTPLISIILAGFAAPSKVYKMLLFLAAIEFILAVVIKSVV